MHKAALFSHISRAPCVHLWGWTVVLIEGKLQEAVVVLIRGKQIHFHPPRLRIWLTKPSCRCRSPGGGREWPWRQHRRSECQGRGDLSRSKGPAWPTSTDSLQPSRARLHLAFCCWLYRCDPEPTHPRHSRKCQRALASIQKAHMHGPHLNFLLAHILKTQQVMWLAVQTPLTHVALAEPVGWNRCSSLSYLLPCSVADLKSHLGIILETRTKLKEGTVSFPSIEKLPEIISLKRVCGNNWTQPWCTTAKLDRVARLATSLNCPNLPTLPLAASPIKMVNGDIIEWIYLTGCKTVKLSTCLRR